MAASCALEYGDVVTLSVIPMEHLHEPDKIVLKLDREDDKKTSNAMTSGSNVKSKRRADSDKTLLAGLAKEVLGKEFLSPSEVSRQGCC